MEATYRVWENLAAASRSDRDFLRIKGRIDSFRRNAVGANRGGRGNHRHGASRSDEEDDGYGRTVPGLDYLIATGSDEPRTAPWRVPDFEPPSIIRRGRQLGPIGVPIPPARAFRNFRAFSARRQREERLQNDRRCRSEEPRARSRPRPRSTTPRPQQDRRGRQTRERHPWDHHPMDRTEQNRRRCRSMSRRRAVIIIPPYELEPEEENQENAPPSYESLEHNHNNNNRSGNTNDNDNSQSTSNSNSNSSANLEADTDTARIEVTVTETSGSQESAPGSPLPGPLGQMVFTTGRDIKTGQPLPEDFFRPRSPIAERAFLMSDAELEESGPVQYYVRKRGEYVKVTPQDLRKKGITLPGMDGPNSTSETGEQDSSSTPDTNCFPCVAKQRGKRKRSSREPPAGGASNEIETGHVQRAKKALFGKKEKQKGPRDNHTEINGISPLPTTPTKSSELSTIAQQGSTSETPTPSTSTGAGKIDAAMAIDKESYEGNRGTWWNWKAIYNYAEMDTVLPRRSPGGSLISPPFLHGYLGCRECANKEPCIRCIAFYRKVFLRIAQGWSVPFTRCPGCTDHGKTIEPCSACWNRLQIKWALERHEGYDRKVTACNICVPHSVSKIRCDECRAYEFISSRGLVRNMVMQDEVDDYWHGQLRCDICRELGTWNVNCPVPDYNPESPPWIDTTANANTTEEESASPRLRETPISSTLKQGKLPTTNHSPGIPNVSPIQSQEELREKPQETVSINSIETRESEGEEGNKGFLQLSEATHQPSDALIEGVRNLLTNSRATSPSRDSTPTDTRDVMDASLEEDRAICEARETQRNQIIACKNELTTALTEIYELMGQPEPRGGRISEIIKKAIRNTTLGQTDHSKGSLALILLEQLDAARREFESNIVSDEAAQDPENEMTQHFFHWIELALRDMLEFELATNSSPETTKDTPDPGMEDSDEEFPERRSLHDETPWIPARKDKTASDDALLETRKNENKMDKLLSSTAGATTPPPTMTPRSSPEGESEMEEDCVLVGITVTDFIGVEAPIEGEGGSTDRMEETPPAEPTTFSDAPMSPDRCQKPTPTKQNQDKEGEKETHKKKPEGEEEEEEEVEMEERSLSPIPQFDGPADTREPKQRGKENLPRYGLGDAPTVMPNDSMQEIRQDLSPTSRERVANKVRGHAETAITQLGKAGLDVNRKKRSKSGSVQRTLNCLASADTSGLDLEPTIAVSEKKVPTSSDPIPNTRYSYLDITMRCKYCELGSVFNPYYKHSATSTKECANFGRPPCFCHNCANYHQDVEWSPHEVTLCVPCIIEWATTKARGCFEPRQRSYRYKTAHHNAKDIHKKEHTPAFRAAWTELRVKVEKQLGDLDWKSVLHVAQGGELPEAKRELHKILGLGIHSRTPSPATPEEHKNWRQAGLRDTGVTLTPPREMELREVHVDPNAIQKKTPEQEQLFRATVTERKHAQGRHKMPATVTRDARQDRAQTATPVIGTPFAPRKILSMEKADCNLKETDPPAWAKPIEADRNKPPLPPKTKRSRKDRKGTETQGSTPDPIPEKRSPRDEDKARDRVRSQTPSSITTPTPAPSPVQAGMEASSILQNMVQQIREERTIKEEPTSTTETSAEKKPAQQFPILSAATSTTESILPATLRHGRAIMGQGESSASTSKQELVTDLDEDDEEILVIDERPAPRPELKSFRRPRSPVPALVQDANLTRLTSFAERLQMDPNASWHQAETQQEPPQEEAESNTGVPPYSQSPITVHAQTAPQLVQQIMRPVPSYQATRNAINSRLRPILPYHANCEWCVNDRHFFLQDGHRGPNNAVSHTLFRSNLQKWTDEVIKEMLAFPVCFTPTLWSQQ